MKENSYYAPPAKQWLPIMAIWQNNNERDTVAAAVLLFLTLWARSGQNVADDIFKRIFSIKKYRSKFNWSVFLKVKQQYSSISSDNGLAPTRRQAINWSNDD